MLGCSNSNDLQSISLDTAKILNKASQLVEITSSENIVEEGEVTGTIVRFNKDKAVKYLNSQSEILAAHYTVIKTHYLKQGPHSNDALYIMAIINHVTASVSGEPVEDQCKYIKIINQKKINKVSLWVLDEFFSQLISNEHYTINIWKKMEINEKMQIIDVTLLVPDENGENCLTIKEK